MRRVWGTEEKRRTEFGRNVHKISHVTVNTCTGPTGRAGTGDGTVVPAPPDAAIAAPDGAGSAPLPSDGLAIEFLRNSSS